MSHRFSACFIMFAVLIVSASCAKVGEPGPGEQKSVLENLTKPDSIPANWGKLVSVSSSPGLEYWVQLWFQDDEGTIRVVRYNVRDNFLSSKASVIPRN
jgi:hypothetical protein